MQYVYICNFIWFYDITTIVGYLMPNPFLYTKLFYFKQLSLAKVHSKKRFYFKQFSLA